MGWHFGIAAAFLGVAPAEAYITEGRARAVTDRHVIRSLDEVSAA